jgi:pyruvate dehydrogenase (quinone)
MVLENGDLNQVTWEQRVMEGDPKFSGSQDVPAFPYAEYARILGLNGIKVDRSDAIGQAWDEALASDRPTVLEMVTDPNVPPLPPHVSLKQTKDYLSALIKGDVDASAVVRASAKQVWASLVPPEGATAQDRR